MTPRSLWRSLLSHPRLWLGLLLWAIFVLVGLIALRAAVPDPGPVTGPLGAALAATALLALFVLALLGVRFYAGIRAVRDNLYQGNYEEALDAAREHASVAVGVGMESALLRLLEFDRRRAEKVATATRLFDRLMREAPTPILVGDLEKEQIRFSHALRDRFGISEDRFSIDSLLRQPANAEFARHWQALASGEKTQTDVALTLHLPVRQAAQPLDLGLSAVQNDQGRIAYILGFARPPAAAESHARPEADEVSATE